MLLDLGILKMKESNKISSVDSDQVEEIDYSGTSRLIYGMAKRLSSLTKSPRLPRRVSPPHRNYSKQISTRCIFIKIPRYSQDFTIALAQPRPPHAWAISCRAVHSHRSSPHHSTPAIYFLPLSLPSLLPHHRHPIILSKTIATEIS